MQKAEQQKGQPHNQTAARQGGGKSVVAPKGERIAQLLALAEGNPQMERQGLLAAQINASPAMTAQRKLIDRISSSPNMSAQRKLGEEVNNSPRMVAQRKQLYHLSGGAVQMKGVDEGLLQGKFETAQRVEEESVEGEEEELLQGKFETAQRVEEEAVEGEEEELLQGKFETAQRVEEESVEGEEEELLQGKFETAQRMEEEAMEGEEEEPLQGKFETVQRVEEEEPLQGKFTSQATAQLEQQSAAKPNNTSLPDNLKSGIENLSGMSMDNVKVHYNSSQPAQLNALAYAQGSDIHVAPGQERHLPHEAWHVVQQAQGRVKPTMQMKGGVPVNDDKGLENEADVMGAKAVQIASAGKGALEIPINKASAPQTSNGTSQMLWDKEKFKENTNAGRFVSRGAAVQEIDKLIDEYDKLQKKWLNVKKTDLVFIHTEIGKAIENWIEYHKGEERQAKRIAAFTAFLNGNYAVEQRKLDKLGDKGDESIEESKSVTELKLQLEGTGDAFFAKLGKAVEKIVPKNGDASSLEVEVKVPAGPSIYVGGKIKLNAAKDDDFVKTGAEVNLTVGGSVGIAELEGSLGGYIESEASTAADAIELMSYGLYQRGRNSKVCPEALVNAMWGGGRTGSLGYTAAEKKAADREKRIFLPLKIERDKLKEKEGALETKQKDAQIKRSQLEAKAMGGSPEPSEAKKIADELDAVISELATIGQEIAANNEQIGEIKKKIEHTAVESGGTLGAKAEVGVDGVGKLGVEASRKSGRKIGLEEVAHAKKDKIGEVRKHGETIKKMGKSTKAYEVKGSLEIGPATAEITYARKTEGKGEDAETKNAIKASGALELPAEQLVEPILKLGEKGAKFIRSEALKSEQKNKPSGKDALKAEASAAAFDALQTSGKEIRKAFKGSDSQSDGDMIKGSVALKVEISKEFGGDFAIEIGSVRTKKLSIGVLEAKHEKSSRLFKGTYGGGKWTFS